MKELVMSICEAYDYQGLTIMELANQFEMTEQAILEVLSQYSDSFNIVE